MTYEDWWLEFTSVHPDWRYADSEALRKAAFESGAASRDAEVAKAFEDGRQAEREECAKICDKYTEFSGSPSNFAENCAKAIRARGDTK